MFFLQKGEFSAWNIWSNKMKFRIEILMLPKKNSRFSLSRTIELHMICSLLFKQTKWTVDKERDEERTRDSEIALSKKIQIINRNPFAKVTSKSSSNCIELLMCNFLMFVFREQSEKWKKKNEAGRWMPFSWMKYHHKIILPWAPEWTKKAAYHSYEYALISVCLCFVCASFYSMNFIQFQNFSFSALKWNCIVFYFLLPQKLSVATEKKWRFILLFFSLYFWLIEILSTFSRFLNEFRFNHNFVETFLLGTHLN